MKVPPKRLDGAVVLYYVTLSARYRSTGATKHFVDGHEASAFVSRIKEQPSE